MIRDPGTFRLVIVLEAGLVPKMVRDQWREVARDAHGLVLRERPGSPPEALTLLAYEEGADAVVRPTMAHHHFVAADGKRAGPYWHPTGLPVPRRILAPSPPLKEPGDPAMRDAVRRARELALARGEDPDHFAYMPTYRTDLYAAMFGLADAAMERREATLLLRAAEWLLRYPTESEPEGSTPWCIGRAFDRVARRRASGETTPVPPDWPNEGVPWFP